MNQKKQFLNKSGVYIIKNIINGKFYIGSSKNIGYRFTAHLNLLNKQIHSNIHLQRSFNKHSIENFVINALIYCPENELLDWEQFFIDQLKPEFNISLSSLSPMKGRKHSEATMEKLNGREPWNRGIPRTEEEKKLMSIRRKEEWTKKTPEEKQAYSEAHSKNPSMYWLGKKLPPEALEKIRAHAKIISHKIKCIETNQIFNSQLQASKKLGIKQGHISEQLNGKRANVKGYTFERISE